MCYFGRWIKILSSTLHSTTFPIARIQGLYTLGAIVLRNKLFSPDAGKYIYVLKEKGVLVNIYICFYILKRKWKAEIYIYVYILKGKWKAGKYIYIYIYVYIF